MWDICMMAWRIGQILGIHEQIEWIWRAGFDGLGFHASPGVPGQWQGIDLSTTDVKARAMLRSALSGFAMCEIHAPFANCLKPGSLLTAVERLLPALDLAGDVGASVVTVHAEPPASPSEADAFPWGEALERLNARAAKNGVVIGLELTEGFDWIAGLGLSNVGVTLDVGHMYLDGGKALQPFAGIGEVVRRIGDALVHLHLHDYDGVHDHIELATGQVDLVGVLNALKGIGYQGGLCLELNPDRVSPEGIRRSLGWLRDLAALP